uniref:Uncharacterized protein n=1 Tax=Trichogramma kaykai TaxID=54128 RepID=A0ABD2VYD1_9HYME
MPKIHNQTSKSNKIIDTCNFKNSKTNRQQQQQQQLTIRTRGSQPLIRSIRERFLRRRRAREREREEHPTCSTPGMIMKIFSRSQCVQFIECEHKIGLFHQETKRVYIAAAAAAAALLLFIV